jgi:hypothetical protein
LANIRLSKEGAGVGLDVVALPPDRLELAGAVSAAPIAGSAREFSE